MSDNAGTKVYAPKATEAPSADAFGAVFAAIASTLGALLLALDVAKYFQPKSLSKSNQKPKKRKGTRRRCQAADDDAAVAETIQMTHLEAELFPRRRTLYLVDVDDEE